MKPPGIYVQLWLQAQPPLPRSAKRKKNEREGEVSLIYYFDEFDFSKRLSVS